jgi:hypothetical protein
VQGLGPTIRATFPSGDASSSAISCSQSRILGEITELALCRGPSTP